MEFIADDDLLGITSGQLALKDLTSVGEDDLLHVVRLAAAAFESGRFEHARVLFAGLEALEPECSTHTLNRAHAEAKLGMSEAAMISLSRFLRSDAGCPVADRVDAFLLRASLRVAYDPAGAELDVRAAQILEEAQ